MNVALFLDDGQIVDLPVDRWMGEPTREENHVLDRVVGPVLDVGCGPGRHVLALARRGVTSLGIDTSPRAVELARSRGAPVLERSVFDRIPGAGRWGSALLLDGNIGIAGDPEALVRRVSSLLRPGGRILIELEGPGLGTGSGLARIHHGGAPGPAFPWARVSTDGAHQLAAGAGATLEDVWEDGRRWFARMDIP